MKSILRTTVTSLAVLLAAAGPMTFGVATIVSRPDATLSAGVADVLAEAMLAGMELGERVGQLFIIDLRGEPGSPVRRIDEDIRKTVKRYSPGGVLLFGENIDTVEQTVGLVNALQRISRIPMTIAVDYEGGLVSRLTSSGKIPATRIPPAGMIGEAGSFTSAYEIGRIMGAELGSLGITMNLAPVADVLTNPASMIGNRSFSSDPRVAAAMTGAMVRGIQDAGVSSVVKHFPGHGDTVVDTHDELAELRSDRERLRSVEFVPFAAAVDAGADGVMVAHIVVPSIAGSDVPATFSRRLITDELRGRLGHESLIITDSLAMKAIRSRWGSGEAAVMALLAGVDIVLQPFRFETAYDAVLAAAESGRIGRERIDASVRRILRVKMMRGVGRTVTEDPYEVLGNPAHVGVVERIQARVDR